MCVLVAFASAEGSTQGIAERIARRLTDHGIAAAAHSVYAADESIDVASYTAIVVGSAIHDGTWLPVARAWVRSNASAIAILPCWLFSVSTLGDEESAFAPFVAGILRRARKEAREITEIRRFLRAREHRNFAGVIGGENWSRVGRWFMAAFRIKKGDYRNWQAIDAWADKIASELQQAS